MNPPQKKKRELKDLQWPTFNYIISSSIYLNQSKKISIFNLLLIIVLCPLFVTLLKIISYIKQVSHCEWSFWSYFFQLVLFY